MSQLALTTAGETRSKWALPRLHPGLWLSYCFLGTLIAASVLASFVAPHSPTDQNLTNTFAGPSAQHLLGTDGFGRDVLSRLIWEDAPPSSASRSLSLSVCCWEFRGG
ncbi:hypothetical protein ACETU7_05190 [Rhodococcus sp. 3Y1]